MVSYILADDLTDPSVTCQLDSNIVTGAIPPSSQNNWPLCDFKNLRDGEHKLTVYISDPYPLSSIFFDYLLYTLASNNPLAPNNQPNATVESTRTGASLKSTKSTVMANEASSTHLTNEVGTTTMVPVIKTESVVVVQTSTFTTNLASNSSADISSTTVFTSTMISFTSGTSAGTTDVPTAGPSRTVPVRSRNNRNIATEIVVGVGTFLFVTIAIFFLWRYKKHAEKQKKTSRELSARNPSQGNSSVDISASFIRDRSMMQAVIPDTNRQTWSTIPDHSATPARLGSADSTQMSESLGSPAGSYALASSPYQITSLQAAVVEEADKRAVLETPQRAGPISSDLNAAILGFRQWSLNRPFPSPTISMFSKEADTGYVDATAEVSEIPIIYSTTTSEAGRSDSK